MSAIMPALIRRIQRLCQRQRPPAWFSVPVKGPPKPIIQASKSDAGYWFPCQFRRGDHLRYDACGSDQTQKCGDWRASFDNFNIDYHDPSHHMHCTTEYPSTWPQACRQTAAFHPNLAFPNLEWKPHSDHDAFTYTQDGRLPGPELGAMFQRYRRGPASILMPSYPTACCDPTKCRCLYYKTGDNIGRPSATAPSNYASFFRNDWLSGYWLSGYCYYHYYGRDHGYGPIVGEVRLSKHWHPQLGLSGHHLPARSAGRSAPRLSA